MNKDETGAFQSHLPYWLAILFGDEAMVLVSIQFQSENGKVCYERHQYLSYLLAANPVYIHIPVCTPQKNVITEEILLPTQRV